MSRSFKQSACGVVVTLGLTVAWLAAAEPAAKDDPALARTRKNVQMLDDIYKTAVVLITKTYVNKPDDVAAATAARLLFTEIKKKGWHDARLIDATGTPYLDENAPADEFEREAIKQLVSGKGYYDQVVDEKGTRYLRAATPVPVVMDKCIMCHEHYKTVKPNAPIGALVYKLKVE